MPRIRYTLTAHSDVRSGMRKTLIVDRKPFLCTLTVEVSGERLLLEEPSNLVICFPVFFLLTEERLGALGEGVRLNQRVWEWRGRGVADRGKRSVPQVRRRERAAKR